MISRSGNKGFFAAHYEWVAVAVGVLALAGGGLVFALSLGEEPGGAGTDEVARINQSKPAETGVNPLDMASYFLSLTGARSPKTIAEVSEKDSSFLASEKRVKCAKCKKAIPGDVKAVPVCPFCGEKQAEEKKVVVDADGDGLPDEWEVRHGLNAADAADANADADGDGFTNLEEFLAKTDPTNKNDHPPYIDSLSVELPLKETKMSFVFRRATKIPSGWRCEFFDPVRRDSYNRRGLTMTATIGQEIASGDGKYKTGFKVKQYTPKVEKRAIKGGEGVKGAEGMKRDVDVSEVVVERVKDGKCVTLVISQGKTFRLAPVDVQATLRYERGEVRRFEVVPGAEIDLNGEKFKVLDIQSVGKGATVTLENGLTGKKHTLKALEQEAK